MTDQRHRQVDDAARQAAGVHELAGKDEEGHRHENEVVGSVDGVLGDQLRIEHSHVQHQRNAANHQGKGDRHAERHGAEQRSEKNGNDHVNLLLAQRSPEGAPC